MVIHNKNVVIIGGSYSGNQGATLMMKNAMKGIEDFSKTKISFDVWVENVSKNKLFIDDNNVNLIEFSPFKFLLKIIPLLYLTKWIKLKINDPLFLSAQSADLFYDVSGICFIDRRKLIFLIYDFLIIRPAIILKKPIIKGSQACGPFKDKFNKLLAKNTLNKCTQINARGEYTKRNLDKLGLKNTQIASDLGFYIDSSLFTNEAILNKPKSPIIGISISSVVYTKCKKAGIDYLALIEDLINHIIKKIDGTVIMIPNAFQLNSNKFRNNDLKIIELLKTRNNAEFLFYKDHLTLNKLRSLIDLCDFLVVSRFHSMVNALSLNKPLIVLGWSHKYEEVLKMFEIEQVSFQFNNMDEVCFLQKFEELFYTKEELQKKIEKNHNKVQTLSKKNFSLINEILN